LCNKEDLCYRTTDTCINIQYTGAIENMYYYQEVYSWESSLDVYILYV